MFLMLGDRYLLPPGIAPAPGEIRETPTLGLFHPSAGRYFSTPKEYLGWYEGEQERAAAAVAAAAGQGGVGGEHRVAPSGSPRVAVLLYRKHVVTKQGYISQMIRYNCTTLFVGAYRRRCRVDVAVMAWVEQAVGLCLCGEGCCVVLCRCGAVRFVVCCGVVFRLVWCVLSGMCSRTAAFCFFCSRRE